jgi:acylglycerol lipase
MKQFYLSNYKNNKINVIEGQKINNIKCILLHVHGLGAHFQPIYKSLDDFKERDNIFKNYNIKSFAFEFHGHGKSGGTRCSINNFDDLLFDLNLVLTYLKTIYDYPIYLLSESMGSAICIKYCIMGLLNENIKINKKVQITNYIKIQGLILLSPLCGIKKEMQPKPFVKKLLVCFSYCFPNLKLITQTKNMAEKTTNNIDFIQARQNNLYSYKYKHRLCTGRELLKMTNWINDHGYLLELPTLIFHGEKDNITDPRITEKLYNNINTIKKELYLIPNGDHSLLLDSTLSYNILQKISDWIITNLEVII